MILPEVHFNEVRVTNGPTFKPVEVIIHKEDERLLTFTRHTDAWPNIVLDKLVTVEIDLADGTTCIHKGTFRKRHVMTPLPTDYFEIPVYKTTRFNDVLYFEWVEDDDGGRA